MARGVYFGLSQPRRRRQTILVWLAIGVLEAAVGIVGIAGKTPSMQLGVQDSPLLLGIVFIVLPLVALACGNPDAGSDVE